MKSKLIISLIWLFFQVPLAIVMMATTVTAHGMAVQTVRAVVAMVPDRIITTNACYISNKAYQSQFDW